MSRSPIPVIHSIPSSTALIETVLREYPTSSPRSCKLYKRGLNDTYLVFSYAPGRAVNEKLKG